MEKLTIEEIIEHCERKVNGIARYRKDKEYWEHKQVKEYLEELKRYKELEERGKVITIPYNVGDIVYIIKGCFDKTVENKVIMARVTGFRSAINLKGESFWFMDMSDGTRGYLTTSRGIGEIVFPTEQEAYEALEEMEEKGL